MPLYKMPDGNDYELTNDAEATQAWLAWEKQLGPADYTAIDATGRGDEIGGNEKGVEVAASQQLTPQQIDIQRQRALASMSPDRGVSEKVMSGLGYGGFVEPAMGVQQLLSKAFGSEKQQQNVEQERKMLEQSYRGQQKMQPGEMDQYALLGSLVSPVYYAAGGAASAPFRAKALYTAVSSGVGASVVAPVGTPDAFWEEKAKQAGFGAGAGTVMHKMNKVLMDLNPEAKDLIEKGVEVPVGEVYKGVPGWVFRQMEKVNLGPKDSAVRKSLSVAVANDVLSPIGGSKLTQAMVKEGEELSGVVSKRISDTYTDAFKQMGTVTVDSQVTTDVTAALTKAKAIMPPEKYKQFENTLKYYLEGNYKTNVFKGGGQTNGDSLKKAQSWLREQRFSKVDEKDDTLKEAYTDLLNAFEGFIQRNDKTGNIAKADEAYKRYLRFANAVNNASTTKGFFGPEELYRGIAKESASATKLSKGGEPLQRVYRDARAALGERGDALDLSYRNLGVASKAAGGGYLDWAKPVIAIPVMMAAGLPYKAAEKLAKSPKAREFVAKSAAKLGPSQLQAVLNNAIRQEQENEKLVNLPEYTNW